MSIKPVGYLDMLVLEKNSKKIITDSAGGVQKEAYFLKIPCITLRDETEWIETVRDKWNILKGADKNKILKAIKNFKHSGKQHRYLGNYNVAKKIVKIINKNYQLIEMQ